MAYQAVNSLAVGAQSREVYPLLRSSMSTLPQGGTVCKRSWLLLPYVKAIYGNVLGL